MSWLFSSISPLSPGLRGTECSGVEELFSSVATDAAIAANFCDKAVKTGAVCAGPNCKRSGRHTAGVFPFNVFEGEEISKIAGGDLDLA